MQTLKNILIFALAILALTPAMGHGTQTNAARRVQRVVELTNIERMKAGLAPLKFNAQLGDAAQWMAQDMAQNNYFAHTDKLGRGIVQRIPAHGYAKARNLGENLAAGQASVADAMKAWLTSEGHRANLLSPNYREIGASYLASDKGSYETYWVQEFGSRANVYPLIINGEAAQTESAEVKLYVHGKEWAQGMRFSNDGKNWTEWETFTSEKSWNLEKGEGTRTVYVEIRNTDGEILTAEDTIMLSTSALADRNTTKTAVARK